MNTTDFAAIIDTTTELIAPYVEKDATAFYSYEEFEIGVAALWEFCLLRAESVQGQLDGTIPSTNEDQSMDSEALIDASTLSLSDMGSMNMGGLGFSIGGNRRGERDENNAGNSFGGIDGNLGDILFRRCLRFHCSLYSICRCDRLCCLRMKMYCYDPD